VPSSRFQVQRLVQQAAETLSESFDGAQDERRSFIIEDFPFMALEYSVRFLATCLTSFLSFATTRYSAARSLHVRDMRRFDVQLEPTRAAVFAAEDIAVLLRRVHSVEVNRVKGKGFHEALVGS